MAAVPGLGLLHQLNIARPPPGGERLGSTDRTTLPAPVPASPSSGQPEGSSENAHSAMSVLGLTARWLLVTQDGIRTPNEGGKTLDGRALCSPPRFVSESPACPLATPYSGLDNWTTDDSEDTEIRPPWALHMLCPLGGGDTADTHTPLPSVWPPHVWLLRSQLTPFSGETFAGRAGCLQAAPAVVHASPAFSAAVTA